MRSSCSECFAGNLYIIAVQELYAEIISKTKVKLIASGGVSCFEDVEKLVEIGCEGAIIGKAIYENRISLKDLRKLC